MNFINGDCLSQGGKSLDSETILPQNQLRVNLTFFFFFKIRTTIFRSARVV